VGVRNVGRPHLRLVRDRRRPRPPWSAAQAWHPSHYRGRPALACVSVPELSGAAETAPAVGLLVEVSVLR
jgi:hypothetical protein